MIYSKTSVTLATGSGFFWRNKNSVYLITNWHNLTGKNPFTKTLLADHGGIPDIVRFPLLGRTDDEISVFYLDVNLYFDDEMSIPGWFIHPNHKENVDVIALEFLMPNDVECVAINDEELKFKEFNPVVADDAFILGFPLPNKQMGLFPVWKRASIASEPEYDYDNKPIILVDSASRPGMSGSPVILRRNGIWPEPQPELEPDSAF